MKIHKINIQNILSYKSAEVNFDDKLNIFVGANGSGKSNLLNILIFAVKRYCFQNFSVDLSYGSEMQGERRYSIREKYPLFNMNEKKFLTKHKMMQDDPQKLIINLELENGDFENFLKAKEYQPNIIDFMRRKVDNYISMMDAPPQVGKEEIMHFFDIDEMALRNSKDLELIIEEKGGVLTLTNDINSPAMTYMRYFSLVRTILDLQGIHHEIGSPFTFFEAYRNNSQESTVAGISTNNTTSYTNTQSVANMSNLANSIGYAGTYITMATKRFGETQRLLLEEKNNRTIDDNENYKKLKEFFKKFGYELFLKCIDPLNNIYQFYIENDGVVISIDAVSSGEREILNFLFGLFLDEAGDNVIVIDEPELHLHPRWQKQLIEILKTASKERSVQIFMVTHSADFINYDVLGDIFRISRANGGSICSHIQESFADENDSARKKMAVVNATNNGKILFANYVIMVEGITDEILFRKILTSEFINNEYLSGIEIVNVGGKGNFEKFEKVIGALSIPYSKVADYDYLNEFKNEMAPELLSIRNKELVDVIADKNKKEIVKELVGELEAFCNKNRCDGADEVRNKYKTFREFFEQLKKRNELNEGEKNKIQSFIKKKYSNGTYILKEGEIEDYLDEGSPNNKERAFKRVVEISEDDNEYQKYKNRTEKRFNELVEILTSILDDAKVKTK